EGMVSALQSNFPTLSSITYSDQTCHCSASVSSSSYQVCREVYPDQWAVECWNGYYLDKSTGECVSACDSGSELNTESGTCVSVSASVDDAIRVQVCEGHSNMMPVLEEGASSITCGCRAAWYGDDCDQLYQVYIPDELFREKVCNYAGYGAIPCDVSEFEMAGQSVIFNVGANTDVTSANSLSPAISVNYLSSLNQLLYLYIFANSDYSLNICDFNSLFTLNRLQYLYIYGNEQIYDISVSFRNVGMYMLDISNTSKSAFIPLCRSEDDTAYWDFIAAVFPIHYSSQSSKDVYFLPNSCPINLDNYYYCDGSNCPSIVLNEVYNSVADTPVKECAFIAKEGSAGECYTVHDDNIRQYLKDYCLSGNDPETNGIISVATMRSKLTCSSLSLSEVVSSSSSSVSTLDEITTLQGLEYAQGTDSNGESIGLTSLNIDGYDLSGNINENAEYDKLVVQILAKAVTYDSIDSGLTSLSASGCGLSAVSDVLDLTPIVDNALGFDTYIQPSKLTSLDLSNNNISDVSVLITSSMFPDSIDGVLTTLDISGNNICDIEGMVSALQSNFSTLSSITYSDQTCHCSASVSSSDHQVCREVYPDQWAVECWNGYYLDKSTGECAEATDSSDTIRCQVCERKEHYFSTLNPNDSSISCQLSCKNGYTGDSCSILVPTYSLDCARSFTVEDHLECNEVYPGRYAAECEEGYYYDQGEYSCVEDTDADCPSHMNDHQMCVKTSGDIITSDCRSAWYGDECDQLYQVHIPDPLFRGKVCDAVGYVETLCDVSEFEMAGISGHFYSNSSHISTLIGAKYLINTNYFNSNDSDISGVIDIASLGQLPSLYIDQERSNTYSMDIYDINSIYTLHRLYRCSFHSNMRIFDITVTFRNIGLNWLEIADLEYDIALIPLCRSEEDDDYWSIISSILPIYKSDTDAIENNFLPNICPINVIDTYYCDSSYIHCPSILLNEVFNSVDDVNEKQCAFIAKTSGSVDDGDLTCYTIHDDNIRAYLSDPANGCLISSDIESNGMISVATLRSSLSCSSLNLSSIVTS
ncbi:hypothetical protein ADUPG1_007182, partial [Aduncisulcus paluster]